MCDVPSCTCWSAWQRSWWELPVGLCLSAPWSAGYPPRPFPRALCSQRYIIFKSASISKHFQLLLPKTFPHQAAFNTHARSIVFSLTVSSPSAIRSSSSFSLASLCSGASCPKSLLVMPLKENVRTIWGGEGEKGQHWKLQVSPKTRSSSNSESLTF